MGIDNPLHRAILEDDLDLSRQFIIEQPELALEDPIGRGTVVDLALAKFELSLVVALEQLGVASDTWKMAEHFIDEYLS